jgi:DNA-binding HxlR family transcriptional regulator
MVGAEHPRGSGSPTKRPADETDVQYRSGERTLGLLSTPLNLSVLRALSERPMRLAELRQATGLPAQTTLRGHLGGLEGVGQ